MAKRAAREQDPLTQLRSAAQALKSGNMARAYLLRGEERWFREKAIELLRKKATEREMEICSHDGADPDFRLPRLLEDLSGGGLFAAERLVVARNVDSALKKSGSADSALTRALVAALADDGFSGCIVLAPASLRADHKAAKAVAAAGGTTITCRKLWDSPPPWDPDPRKAELVGFVEDRARAAGLKLDPRECVYVAAATGNDLTAIEDQLERLRHVAPSERRSALGWEAAGNPFQLADPIIAGDARKALFGIETLFRQGFQKPDGKREEDPAALFAMVAGTLRNKLREALWTAGSPGDAPGKTDRAREQALARARIRSVGEWRSMLDDLGELERRARTGSRIDENDLVLFTSHWARKAQAARR